MDTKSRGYIMTMHKKLKSDAPIIVGGGDSAQMYPRGFAYMVGNEGFEVTQVFNGNPPMRRIKRDDGTFEDVTVDTIAKDLDETKNGGHKVTLLPSTVKTLEEKTRYSKDSDE